MSLWTVTLALGDRDGVADDSDPTHGFEITGMHEAVDGHLRDAHLRRNLGDR